MILIFQIINWGSEEENDSPKVTELISETVGVSQAPRDLSWSLKDGEDWRLKCPTAHKL